LAEKVTILPDVTEKLAFELGFADRLQTAVWVFDIERQRILWANRAALGLWRATELDELLQRDFGTDMSSATATRLQNYLDTFRRGETVTESWTFFPDSTPTTVMCRCSGYPLDDGELVMLVEGTPMDSVEAPTLRAVEALRHSSVLISVYDVNGKLLFRNPAAEETIGATGTLSQHFVHDEDWRSVRAALDHDDVYDMEVAVHTAAGERDHHLNIRSVPDPDSGQAMFVVSENDITDIYRAMQAVRDSEQRLMEISNVLADGVFVLDGEGKLTFANRATEKMLGWNASDILGEDAHALFHYRKESGEEYPHHACPVIRSISKGETFRSNREFFIRRDGTLIPVSLAAAPLVRDGKVVGSVSAFHDISEQLKKEEELRENERKLSAAQRRLSALISNLRGAVLVEDEERRIVLVNQRFCDAFEIPATPEQLIGVDCANAAEQSKMLFLKPERFVERIDEILARQEPVIGEEWEMVSGRIFERDYVPIFSSGQYRGHLWQYWDVTERKQAEDELRVHASTDALTGLLNRRIALLSVEQELNRMRRNDHQAVLLMLDVDHFKQINDTYGHAVGDIALRELSAVIRGVVREGDVAGRIGGEEFVILLSHTEAKVAGEVAERLRRHVEIMRTPAAGESVAFTISIGVTPFDGSETSVSTLLARADKALYQAKTEGRNRIVFAD